jgi:hypothetical protein
MSTWTVYEGVTVEGLLNHDGFLIPVILHNVWLTTSEHGYKVQAHKHQRALDIREVRASTYSFKSKRTYTRTDSNKIVTND